MSDITTLLSRAREIVQKAGQNSSAFNPSERMRENRRRRAANGRGGFKNKNGRRKTARNLFKIKSTSPDTRTEIIKSESAEADASKHETGNTSSAKLESDLEMGAIASATFGHALNIEKGKDIAKNWSGRNHWD